MALQTDVFNKLDELKEYSIEINSGTEELFMPTYAAATAYFAADKSGKSTAAANIAKYMYNDIERRTTVYEHDFPNALDLDFPVGYDDIMDCFYDFSGLLNVTNADFYAAFVFEPTAGEEPAETPISNSYLTEWTDEMTAAIETEQPALATLASFCQNSGGDCDLIALYEYRGRPIRKKTNPEIAEIIYIDKNLKQAAELYGLNVYVPTYLRNTR